MMLRIKTIALIGAIYLISVLYRASAFHVVPWPSHGELISLTVNQCSEAVIFRGHISEAEWCYINVSLPFEFDIKLRPNLEFESLKIDATFEPSSWEANRPRPFVDWSESRICYENDPFCTVSGDGERTYHGDLDLIGVGSPWNTCGYMKMELFTNDTLVLSFKFHVSPIPRNLQTRPIYSGTEGFSIELLDDVY